MKKIKLTIVILTLAIISSPFFGIADVRQTDTVTAISSALERGVIINPVDFGADPGGISDSTPAILAALDFARTISGPKTILFPFGRYHFRQEHAAHRIYRASNSLGGVLRSGDWLYGADSYIAILIEDIKDLTVDGQGSKMLFHDFTSPISIMRSENILVQNMNIDRINPNSVAFTVEEVPTPETRIVHISENANYRIEREGNNDFIRINHRGTDETTKGDWMVMEFQTNLRGATPTQTFWQWLPCRAHDFNDRYVALNSRFLQHHFFTGSSRRSEDVPETSHDKCLFRDAIAFKDLGNNRIAITYPSATTTQTFRLGQPNEATVTRTPPEPGFIIEYSCAARYSEAIFITESKDVVVNNIKFGYAQAWGTVTQMNHNLTFRNIDWSTYPGTARINSSSADTMQLVGTRGNLIVENSYFGPSSDDPINAHGNYLSVSQYMPRDRDAIYEFLYSHGATFGFQQFKVGDVVEIFHTTSMQSLGTAKVAEIVKQPDYKNQPSFLTEAEILELRKVMVRLDRNIELTPNSNPRSISPWSRDPGVDIYAHNRPSPQPLYIVENVTHAPNIYIRNNVFMSPATRTVLASSRKVVIEDNYFEGSASPALRLTPEAESQWFESGHATEMIIRGNVFYNLHAAAIMFATAPGNRLVNSNVIIEDNIFYIRDGNNNPIMDLAAIEGLVARNNRFYRETPNVNLTLTAANVANMAQGTTAQAVVGGHTDASNNTAQIIRLRNVIKNAAFYGNIYDNGLNAIIGGAHEGTPGHFPAGTTRLHGEVAIKDDKIVPSRAGLQNNHIPANGTIQYTSRNPGIASVSATGQITAVSPGTTEIYAFVAAADRVFRSNTVTVTVNNTGNRGTAIPNPVILENLRLGDSNALLRTLEIEGLSGVSSISGATASAFAFAPNVRAYQMLADFDENSIKLNALAASETATIEIEANRKIVSSGTSNFNGEIPLVNGYNLIRIVVYAENGVDRSIYRLVINKRALARYDAISISGISFNGVPLAGFNPNIQSYTIPSATESLELSVVPFNEFSQVDIVLDNLYHANTTNITVPPNVERIVVHISVNPDVIKSYVIVRE